MSITFEQVAEAAQKYVAVCPVIILGSGASIPHGVPSMSGLAQELLNRVQVPGRSADETPWLNFKTELARTNDLEKALHQDALPTSLLDIVVRETWKVIAEHDLPVSEAVLADPGYLPLTKLFRHLLWTAQASISVITTTRQGPCDVIMTDNRYFRGNKQAFREEQFKWLEEQLLDCQGPFIIMSCGTMWSDFVQEGKDSWGKYDSKGRERIFNLIEQKKIAGVLLVSGAVLSAGPHAPGAGREVCVLRRHGHDPPAGDGPDGRDRRLQRP